MLLETIQAFLARFQPLRDLLYPPAVVDEPFSTKSRRELREALDVDQDTIRDPTQREELPSGDRTDIEELPAGDRMDIDRESSQDVLLASSDDRTGAFRFAHDFVVQNPVFVSQIIKSGDMGLKILWERRMIGAEVDSDARKYSPKCHPETRKSLQKDILGWMIAKRDLELLGGKPKQTPRMLWIMGPAGVGKSAVAQTIAEKVKGSGRLGASLFFSRPNRRDDPQQVVPTLAYQLAVGYPNYKLILNRRLANDPSLLEKTIRVQFKELILDPFTVIMTQDPSMRHKPLLIILDGLDECKSEEAQCEFIELITEHVRSVQEFPLLWMVCSRPEWHFRYLLSRPDFPATCDRKQMTVDDPEARQDVALFLRDEFVTIRQRFSDYLPPSWPPEKAIQVIVVKASGLFALAAIVARFISDAEARDPDGQLQICLNALDGVEVSGTSNPLATLDSLYREIFSRITSSDLPITKRILAICALYADTIDLKALSLATFLGLSKAQFYRALERLHSVLEIPRADDALHNPLRFYHASFQDYLREPRRSLDYTVNEDVVHCDIALKALEWQIHPSRREFRWTSAASYESDHLALIDSVDKFSMPTGWKACSSVIGVEARRSLVTMLEDFDFRGSELDSDGFPEFLHWLHSMDSGTQSILHIQTPECPPHHSNYQLDTTDQSDALEECRHLFSGLLGNPNYPIRLHLGVRENMCEISLLPKDGWERSTEEMRERPERERDEREEWEHRMRYGPGGEHQLGWQPSAATAPASLPDEETWTSNNLSPRPRDWRADYSPTVYLPRIERVRSDVEEYIDTVKRTLHPVLHHTQGSEPLTFDLRYQIMEGNTLTVSQNEIELAQLATFPPAPILRLYHPRLPWYIDIYQSHPTGVTVFDVLAQMSLQLLAPIHNRHYYNDVLDAADRAALGRAYKERCDGRPGESRKGVLQVDFLGEKYVFDGLARARQGMWEIKSRRNGDPPMG